MKMLMAGEKLMQCLACEHRQVVNAKGFMHIIQCKRCANTFLNAVKVRPTNIHGVGRNKMADLGLALLMEMGADVPDQKDQWRGHPEIPE